MSVQAASTRTPVAQMTLSQSLMRVNAEIARAEHGLLGDNIPEAVKKACSEGERILRRFTPEQVEQAGSVVAGFHAHIVTRIAEARSKAQSFVPPAAPSLASRTAAPPLEWDRRR